MTVCVFVGGRADLSPLAPVLRALAQGDDRVVVLTAVGFDEDGALAALDAEGLPGLEVRAVGPRLGGDSPADATTCGSEISRGMPGALDGASCLVVLGDRWELPWVVMPAVLARVPVVHLHGGEVTEGAIDERVRHAVSKLADVHCVASEESRARLEQMGEDPGSIHVTGAPGLDRLVRVAPASDDELARLAGRPVTRPLALFTYHPVTTEPVAEVVENGVAALRGTADVVGTVVVTHPGPDPGGRQLRDALVESAQGLPGCVVVPSLGPAYPSVLAACDVVVGNSSSGVIEAASAGVPAVDVGERQSGRLRARSVRHVADGRETVRDGVRQVLADARPSRTDNPYGDGDAARRIVDAIHGVPPAAGSKRFRDVYSAVCSDGRRDQ
ncbi:UDP-N-acetylglucosamine 2-epimerase [Cellulosimicrobium cellulans]|uniref:UDP-N-acetylglucosamine 2-epimerase n=1 Tax=Cellulosimicrobium cellulans TaxID=1710 RepID=UPI0036507AF4